jgi:uncharacterized protein YjbJ (UPF0337 family)
MNKQHVKGVANEAAGKAQKAVGDLTDSPSQEAKGMAKEVKGKAQQAAGDVKDNLRDSRDLDRTIDRDVEHDIKRDDTLKR